MLFFHLRRSSPLWNRQKHRDLPPINLVTLAIMIRKIALFKLDGNNDVSSSDGCKQQVPDTHCRSSPKSNDKTDHYRVAHELIEDRRSKSEIFILLASLMQINLAKTE